MSCFVLSNVHLFYSISHYLLVVVVLIFDFLLKNLEVTALIYIQSILIFSRFENTFINPSYDTIVSFNFI